MYRSAVEGNQRMKPPKCTPYPPSTRYDRVVVRSLWYDNDGLTIEVQGPGFVFARVVFRRPAGFRVRRSGAPAPNRETRMDNSPRSRVDRPRFHGCQTAPTQRDLMN